MPLNSYKYLSICHLSIKCYSVFLYNRLKLKSIYIHYSSLEKTDLKQKQKKKKNLGFFCEIFPKEKTQSFLVFLPLNIELNN